MTNDEKLRRILLVTIPVSASLACNFVASALEGGYLPKQTLTPGPTSTLGATSTEISTATATSTATSESVIGTTVSRVFPSAVDSSAEGQGVVTGKTAAELNDARFLANKDIAAGLYLENENPLVATLNNFGVHDVLQGNPDKLVQPNESQANIVAGFDTSFQQLIDLHIALDTNGTAQEKLQRAKQYAKQMYQQFAELTLERGTDGRLHIVTAITLHSFVLDNKNAAAPVKAQSELCVKIVPKDLLNEGEAQAVSGDIDPRVKAWVSMEDDILIVQRIVENKDEAPKFVKELEAAGFKPAIMEVQINGKTYYHVYATVNVTAGMKPKQAGKWNQLWETITRGVAESQVFKMLKDLFHLAEELGLPAHAFMDLCGQGALLGPNPSQTPSGTPFEKTPTLTGSQTPTRTPDGTPTGTPNASVTPTATSTSGVTVTVTQSTATPTPPGVTPTVTHIATNEQQPTAGGVSATPEPQITKSSQETPSGSVSTPTTAPASPTAIGYRFRHQVMGVSKTWRNDISHEDILFNAEQVDPKLVAMANIQIRKEQQRANLAKLQKHKGQARI